MSKQSLVSFLWFYPRAVAALSWSDLTENAAHSSAIMPLLRALSNTSSFSSLRSLIALAPIESTSTALRSVINCDESRMTDAYL